MDLTTILFGALELVLVAVTTFFATQRVLERRATSRVRQAQDEADRILEEAETRRRDAALEAKTRRSASAPSLTAS